MPQGRLAGLAALSFAAILGLYSVSTTHAVAAAEEDLPEVVLETTLGPITVQLDRAKAPITVANFLKYVDEGFYDNTIFHRVIPTFMIQGGGMTDAMQEKQTHGSIKNESGNGLSNKRGTIAMARRNDPDSATAQFFINLFDKNEFLDNAGGGYTVFGKVTAGMPTVDAIAKVATGQRGGHDDVPVKPIYIKSAKRKAKA